METKQDREATEWWGVYDWDDRLVAAFREKDEAKRWMCWVSQTADRLGLWRIEEVTARKSVDTSSAMV